MASHINARMLQKLFVLTLVVLTCLQFILMQLNSTARSTLQSTTSRSNLSSTKNSTEKVTELPRFYDIGGITNAPLIFIGGYARSGTTLMRALLDTHDQVTCGPEKKILPQILSFYFDYRKKRERMSVLQDAGLNETKVSRKSMRGHFLLFSRKSNRPKFSISENFFLFFASILLYYHFLQKFELTKI
jgi:hypothetical protein